MEFHPGERVLVKTRVPTGHCRTPFYLRGKTGVVEANTGAYPNPEELAYHKNGLPKKTLYRVRFEQKHLWSSYPVAKDTLIADIFEHWLEPADRTATMLKAGTSAKRTKAPARTKKIVRAKAKAPATQKQRKKKSVRAKGKSANSKMRPTTRTAPRRAATGRGKR